MSKQVIFRILTLPLWIVACVLAIQVACATGVTHPGRLSFETTQIDLEWEARAEFVATLNQDDRVPTLANISGLWSSGPNLVGFTVQLNQQADRGVTGSGYHWGCVGVYNTFTLTGTFIDGVLAVAMDDQPGRVRHFKCVDVDGVIRLREIVPDGEYAAELRTVG